MSSLHNIYLQYSPDICNFRHRKICFFISKLLEIYARLEAIGFCGDEKYKKTIPCSLFPTLSKRLFPQIQPIKLAPVTGQADANQLGLTPNLQIANK